MGDAEKEPLWTRGFVLATSVTLFTSLVFYLLMTSMALYAVERFNASDSSAGLASSAYILGSLLARVFSGRLLDALGRRSVLLVCLIGQVAASVLYIPVDSLVLLVALRFLHGMAFGAGSTALAVVAQSLIPPARRGEGTGYFYLSTSLSTAAGPLLAVFLSRGGNYDLLFISCAAFSMAALAIVLCMKFDSGLPARTQAPMGGHSVGAARRAHAGGFLEPSALRIGSLMLIAGAAYAGIMTFLAPYALSADRAGAAALFFLVYAGAVVCSRLLAGRIQDQAGDNAVVYPMLVLFAAGLALLAAPPTNLSFAVAGFLAGLGFGSLGSTVQVIAIRAVPEQNLNRTVSTFYLMLDGGAGLGPVVLGLLVPFTGFAGMYLLLSLLVVALLGLYYIMHARRSG